MDGEVRALHDILNPRKNRIIYLHPMEKKEYVYKPFIESIQNTNLAEHIYINLANHQHLLSLTIHITTTSAGSTMLLLTSSSPATTTATTSSSSATTSAAGENYPAWRPL